jgi:hypothetical protein
MFNEFLLENRAVYIVEKYCRAGQATDGNMAHAHCMLRALGYRHTLTICNTYFSSTATTVARTRLNFTLYVHYIACLVSCRFVHPSARKKNSWTEWGSWEVLLKLPLRSVYTYIHMCILLSELVKQNGVKATKFHTDVATSPTGNSMPVAGNGARSVWPCHLFVSCLNEYTNNAWSR